MVSPSALSQTQGRLLNRYSVQETLGARLGRRTLLGYDHQRRCRVIIKYLCLDDPLQPSDIQRFHAEVAALKTLKHPAIPAYCDSFEINDHGYHGQMLIQDYVPGQSLYALVNAQYHFTESDIRQLAHQMLTILDYLHRQQPAIMHRDIKPSSFVLNLATDTKQLYLVDFGLVQSAETTHLADAPILISGTPGYRPPEQLGDRAVPATDLYSLGATLIHLATGKHPSTLPQRGLRILFGQELGHMSRSLKAWLRWLTQPKQHKRPVSVKAAFEGLTKADEIFTSNFSLVGVSQRCRRTRLEAMAPINTKLKLIEYSQTLEIVLPSLGWRTYQFWLAIGQIAVGFASLGLLFYGVTSLWSGLVLWQRLCAVGFTVVWSHLSLVHCSQGIQRTLITLFRQISIQLLPDIILLGHRFPLRPVTYKINTYKQDIDDIDLQPGSTTITVWLRRNRTAVGTLEHMLSARSLGLTQSEIRWINEILQLWLKQPVSPSER